jgi:hypothetical protein
MAGSGVTTGTVDAQCAVPPNGETTQQKNAAKLMESMSLFQYFIYNCLQTKSGLPCISKLLLFTVHLEMFVYLFINTAQFFCRALSTLQLCGQIAFLSIIFF